MDFLMLLLTSLAIAIGVLLLLVGLCSASWAVLLMLLIAGLTGLRWLMERNHLLDVVQEGEAMSSTELSTAEEMPQDLVIHYRGAVCQRSSPTPGIASAQLSGHHREGEATSNTELSMAEEMAEEPVIHYRGNICKRSCSTPIIAPGELSGKYRGGIWKTTAAQPSAEQDDTPKG